MRALVFSLASVKAITRLSICLALLVVFNPHAVASGPQLSPQGNSQNLQQLSSDDLESILRVVQAAEGSLAADQWLQQKRLNPSDAAASMAFGYSVAIDGDILVVGAYWDNSPGGGSAYVFSKPAAGWTAVTQIAKLTPSDPGSRDRFGWSVAISGNTIVVGAPGDDSLGMLDNGSAYVFVKPGGGWTDMTETAKLTASDKRSLDEFGRSLAIDGNTIVIGSPCTMSFENQGSVYVFTKPGTGWTNSTETAILTPSDGTPANRFGYSIAIRDNTIVAGAYAHDNGHGDASGEVYVFSQSGGWTSGMENARLTASDSAANEYFGWSVAIDGDVIVAGAPGEVSFDNSGEDAAYVFIKPVGGWSGGRTEDAVLTASDGAISDDFGTSVDISGDLVVVGAPTDDVASQSDQGSAYVFSKPAGGWANMTETDHLIANDGTNSDLFGSIVRLSGSVVVAGASKDDANALVDTGSAYIFDAQQPPTMSIYLPMVVR